GRAVRSLVFLDHDPAGVHNAHRWSCAWGLLRVPIVGRKYCRPKLAAVNPPRDSRSRQGSESLLPCGRPK
ncbi:MAG: hypothetical protein VB859_02775, partial [Planctomycetaceae bacterium]